ncbi:MAG: ATP-binding protein [Pseudomonadota bacterium]|nr:ATP-binding protein [Pseudomonadota bacterium]
MEPAQLDFSADDAATGFRLHRFEVFNWGTFDRRVWQIEPGGRNSLLTGDIGSGKSTLVDAVTTLLVPHQRIVYNKAAGAEGRERNLGSYVRGEFKSEQDQDTQSARAVALRDESSYSVLLGVFHNAGFDQKATLAQVFWFRPGQHTPEKFFVFAERPLGIKDDFSGFGDDILALKKRLRRRPGVQVFDHFKDYATRFRHLFGIQQEKALELFYQTVSMKSVGNLTDFVRNHMLERFDVESRIEALRRAFENLNRAHQAVVKAREQIERLRPLVGDGNRHAELVAGIERLTGCRDALEPWFAGHRVRLSDRLIARLERDTEVLGRRLETLQQEIRELRIRQDGLRLAIDDSGGRRLRDIDLEIARLDDERRRRHEQQGRYRDHAGALGMDVPKDEPAFVDAAGQAAGRRDALEAESRDLEARRTDLAVELRGLKDRGTELEDELESLRSRRSNIPRRSLEMRARLAEDLGLGEEALPFVGELLQVDGDELRWEGAIERLLHNFGLSLLVPEAHYAAVSRYVDQTRLRGRLVYYRVRDEQRRASGGEPKALYRKLRIRPDSAFYPWLESWLAGNFEHVCCERLQDFHRLPKAVTLQGQIKTGGRRHEKDDRHDIHDRSRYVLGWSNEDKVRALERQLDEVAGKIRQCAGASITLGRRIEACVRLRDHARDLLNVQHYREIHWQEVAAAIQTLQDEKRRIEESSDALHGLRAQLRIVEGGIQKKRDIVDERHREAGRLEDRLERARTERVEAAAHFDAWPRDGREAASATLDELHARFPETSELTLQNLDKQQSLLRRHIQVDIDKNAKGRDRVRDRLISAMQDYKRDYKPETQEVDAAVEALPEYAAMLSDLEGEGLPRHEARFRKMLREETIQGVAMFQARLDREQREIGDKIATINRSLREIEYSPGTYVRLRQDRTQDPEIRDFQSQLRQVLSGALDEEDLYTEAKFLQVKAVIDRFNGREGLVDLDRRWTRKVTDVRNWFAYSASERYREDDQEKEFYSDTAGKSGGQKEKLAYTILASALAYQFGLEWGETRSRSFRFVVIDEAFGRGSDESTRYALKLFEKLDLQLLIVTPLQKIHVIEEYINAVHFVHNEGGHDSIIRNLSVEEYREEKKRFATGTPGRATVVR